MKKVNAVRPKNENNFLRLLLSIKLAEYKIAAESFSEIVLFLVQYSFLFEDTEKLLNSCASEQTQLYTLQENRDLGARYLDPKYSMWKSTDPALNEYMSGSDAGEGGVYNHINLNLYHYAGNNPIRYIDPDGRRILKYSAKYKMNDYNVLLGNEPTGGVTIKKEGCYITAIANLIYAALDSYEKKFTKNDYSSPILINYDKSLFQANSGELNDNAMDKLFGAGNWDYWTKDGQGSPEKLLEKLKEYADNIDGYMILGIFDLSSADSKVTNHMVGINSMPNEEGIFEDIVPTSDGDINRLADEEKRKAYSIKNLKEFRVISVSEFYKCTQGE